MTPKSNQFRDVDGLLLLDKPLHLSSNHALQRVKKLFEARKAGHTGSLDPLATGMLPICFGQATKYCDYLLTADKTYRVKAELGKRTATGDSEGEIISTNPVPNLSVAELECFLNQFKGETEQVPPMFSALKHDGQPLYKLAREGKIIDRASRKIHLYSLKVLEFDGVNLSLELSCSKGTYVRTLIDDLGELIGCGAHVTELRRTYISYFRIDQTVSLALLQSQKEKFSSESLDQYLLPIHFALKHLPVITLNPANTLDIQQGRFVHIERAVSCGVVSLMDENERFLGVGELRSDGILTPKRLQTIS